MKQSFNRFAVRFPTSVLLGLALIALHGQNGFLAIFAPRYASPWELGKLAYWPLLLAMLLTGRSQSTRWDAAAELPGLVLAPLLLFGLFWVLTPLAPGAGGSVLLWILVLAAAQFAATLRCGKESTAVSIWLVLTVALGAAYILLTFLPPLWGPFLEPGDVAAMATIPV